MKQIIVTMPDGSKWSIPAIVVAESRAAYYVELDKPDEESEAFQEEVIYCMNDDGELLDWAENNMNWSDVSGRAKKVAAPIFDLNYQEGWINGEKEIING